MGASAKKLASQFIGAAMQADPSMRPRLFRKAAQTFAQLATDPRNSHAKGHLTAIGLEFAGAASQAATTNDFTQLLRDTAEAWEQLGPDAEFSMHAAQDAQALARGVAASNDPAQAPRMSIAPASWNVDATLGRSVAVKYGATGEEQQNGIFPSQTVAFWQGQKQEAQAMTVDISTVLAISQPSAPHRGGGGDNIDARPYAIIEYGSDGNKQNSVPIDVGTGRRLTVVGNYISVIVAMDPPTEGADAAVMTLGASIGAFAAPSQAPVIRTVYVETINANTDSPFFQIPLRHVRLFPPLGGQSTGSPGPIISITWAQLTGQTICTTVIDMTANLGNYTPIVVPPDAFWFSFQTTIGGGFRFPFELSL